MQEMNKTPLTQDQKIARDCVGIYDLLLFRLDQLNTDHGDKSAILRLQIEELMEMTKEYRNSWEDQLPG